MKALLFVAAVMAAGSAIADDAVARSGKSYVRITDAACPPEVLGLLPPEVGDRFHAAFAVIDGKSFRACWAMLSDGNVVLQYEDGDGGMVPAADFRPAAGA